MKHFKENISAKALTGRALFHLKYSRGKDLGAASTFDKMMCFSHAVRDMAVDGFIATQKQYLDQDVRRVNYLSMEYLIGKMLENNIYALGIEKIASEALEPLKITLDEVLALDVEAGLGNGGLGRLAACYLDSLATKELPATRWSQLLLTKSLLETLRSTPLITTRLPLTGITGTRSNAIRLTMQACP